MNVLLERLATFARTQGRDTALEDDQGQLDYASLWLAIEALAAWLARQPAGPVALALDNGMAWVVMDLACQLSQRPLLPLPAYFTPDQQAHALATAGAVALISPAGQPGSLHVPGWPALGWSSLPAQTLATLPAGTAKITFTSGSTGAPKGVCLSQDNQLRTALALSRVVPDTRPRHLAVLPLATLLENVAGVYVPLLRGGVVRLPGLATLGYGGSRTLDGRALLACISRWQPGSLILVPQLLTLLSEAAQAGWAPPASLDFVAVGGSRVAPEALARARRLGIPAFEGYGLSECSSVISLNVPGDDWPGSAGRVLDHVRVTVSADGELVVTGNAFLGYAGEPGSWGADRVATGDLGQCDEQGRLQLSGRRKHLLINSYGRNISPEWVESQVLGQRGIRECVVMGDARPCCVALIHAPDLSPAAVDSLLASVNATLPDYARIQHWHALAQPLQSDAALFTANGRPRRDAIAARFADTLDTLYPTPETHHAVS